MLEFLASGAEPSGFGSSRSGLANSASLAGMPFNTRSDATQSKNVPAVEQMMPFIMPGRNESVFYMEMDVDMTKIEPFIERWNSEFPDNKITFFHIFVWVATKAMTERSDLNRFVAGGKFWQRDGFWVSYVAKKRLADDAPIVTVKRRFDPEDSFSELVHEMHGDKDKARSDAADTSMEKELGILVKLPSPLLRLGVRALNAADALGLLPKSYIDSDPMFTSLFIANLGSLNMDGGFHHLYEYGNCPLFCVIGKVKQVPAVIDGELGIKTICPLRFTYDERTQDGYYAGKALNYMKDLMEDPIAAGIHPDWQ